MDKKENNVSAEYYTIDLLHIVKRVWHYIWAVALASLIAAAIGFSYAPNSTRWSRPVARPSFERVPCSAIPRYLPGYWLPAEA